MKDLTRREFLTKSTLATAGTMLLPQVLRALERPQKQDNKILIVLQLSGGNDGLNTIIPYQNDLYYRLRPRLAVPPQHVLKVTDELGFNSALASLKSLYDKGQVSIINNVGYPNPDRSHFRSTEIWHTANTSNDYASTGWLGRYLDEVGSLNNHNAIELNDTLSLALKGNDTKAIVLKSDATVPNHYKPSTVPYPNTDFGKQLHTISSLINSRTDTRVYYAALSGFDTHVRQRGQHEHLLTTYAQAVEALVSDLESTGHFNRVVILTFSEFGRRVCENASGGTDHGTANNVFLIGNRLKTPGIINEAPDLSRLDAGELIHTIDFRSIYATVLSKWMDTNPVLILGQQFPLLDLV